MSDINIKKLAEQLQLSISTVSRAFQDSHDISPKTKERVLEFAKKVNYQPNHYASSLREQKSKTIAVVIPEVANNFFSLVIDGIETIAQENGFHVLICITRDDDDMESSFVRHLQSGRVDGILISVSSKINDFKKLLDVDSKKLPIIYFDRVFENFDGPKVITDDYESGFKATEHLIASGCKRIAYLLIAKHLYIGQKRMLGYLDALKKHRIKTEQNLILNCSNDKEENRLLIKRLLEEEKPDGIFASVERLAFACYFACNDLNLSIPGDVKIISFSNLEIASLLNPSLTTITQPAFEMGRQAAILLFKALDKRNKNMPDEAITFSSVLVKRASTGY